jgi:phasin family protein
MADFTESAREVGSSLMSLDMTKMVDEMTRTMAKVKIPGIDMDALVAMQRDNLEALTTANKAAAEGLRAIAEWETKVLKGAMEEVSKAAGALSKVRSPQDLVTEQADVAKQTFQTSVASLRELADIVSSANQAMSRAITERVPDSLDEIKEVMKVKE